MDGRVSLRLRSRRRRRRLKRRRPVERRQPLAARDAQDRLRPRSDHGRAGPALLLGSLPDVAAVARRNLGPGMFRAASIPWPRNKTLNALTYTPMASAQVKVSSYYRLGSIRHAYCTLFLASQ